MIDLTHYSLSPYQIRGKGCMRCNKRRSEANAGVPFAHVGRCGRVLATCKKAHFTDMEDTLKIIATISKQVCVKLI